ncbi:MAG TPA: HAD hydrolase family protein, partial [Acidimicrobiales bacterium]|nr:HAD hydrolase family protein [Acidimicrobiales bacterium]
MTTAPVQLVVTDLDGTLWDGEGVIHPATVAAIDQVLARGIPILAATARRQRSVLPRLAPYGLSFPLVLLDGALGRDPGAGTTFHRRVFDPASPSASAVLQAFVDHGIEPCINVDDERDVVIGPDPSSPPANVAYLASFGARGDLVEVAATAAVFSFQVFGLPREALEPVAVAVRRRGLGSATVAHDITHGRFCLTVRPEGVSKWEGVQAFCHHTGLDPNGVLAIGDGENDVELLEGSGRSAAPAGGSAAARAAAQTVVGALEDGGWADILA